MRVGLLVTCLVDVMRPEIGFSALKLLESAGCDVIVPEQQTCCGQPPFNSGYWDEARAVAAPQLALFRDAEVVVSASGSCGAMMKKFYPELFHDRPEEAAAKTLAAKTYEFSDFLVNRLFVCRSAMEDRHASVSPDGRRGHQGPVDCRSDDSPAYFAQHTFPSDATMTTRCRT